MIKVKVPNLNMAKIMPQIEEEVKSNASSVLSNKPTSSLDLSNAEELSGLEDCTIKPAVIKKPPFRKDSQTERSAENKLQSQRS